MVFQEESEFAPLAVPESSLTLAPLQLEDGNVQCKMVVQEGPILSAPLVSEILFLNSFLIFEGGRGFLFLTIVVY